MLDEVALVVELLLEAEARSNVHGTATCLSPVDDALVVVLLGLVLLLVSVPEVLLVVSEVPPVALVLELEVELKSMIAKSTFPDCGLMITSLMVPRLLP